MEHPASYFDKVYNGSANFMTPNVVMYGFIHNDEETLVYELSKGRGFCHDTIYGVTVLEIDKFNIPHKRNDLSSGGFTSRSSADNYIEDLSDD